MRQLTATGVYAEIGCPSGPVIVRVRTWWSPSAGTGGEAWSPTTTPSSPLDDEAYMHVPPGDAQLQAVCVTQVHDSGSHVEPVAQDCSMHWFGAVMGPLSWNAIAMPVSGPSGAAPASCSSFAAPASCSSFAAPPPAPSTGDSLLSTRSSRAQAVAPTASSETTETESRTSCFMRLSSAEGSPRLTRPQMARG